jgi:hypothetical protein
VRRIVFVFLISALLFIVSCGGSSSSSNASSGSSSPNTSVAGGNTIVTSGNNVAQLIVDGGPASVANSSPDYNMAFTTIEVCAPATTNCVAIDHVQVDTGSTGLRIPYGAFATLPNGATVLAALQNVNPTAPVAECYEFIDSFNWGTVRYADVKMGGSSNIGEVASSVPIQVTGDPSVPTIPSDCTGTETDTVATMGSNGLIGVNFLQYDCDALGFTNPCTSSSTVPPGLYYTCSGSSCSASSGVPLAQQVRNPVSLFAADNNGVILELPSVPVGGGSGISAGEGSLVFGIGTQSNNGLGSAVVLTIDPDPKDLAWEGFTTVFNGVSYPNSTEADMSSVLDSGTPVFSFLDQPTSGITSCTIDLGFYCPSSTKSFTAVNQATGGNSHAVQFNVSDAQSELPLSYDAFSDLGGPNTSGTPDSLTQAEDGYFIWGLPFFYGRNVYTAIWGVTAPTGIPAGPFWAY